MFFAQLKMAQPENEAIETCLLNFEMQLFIITGLYLIWQPKLGTWKWYSKPEHIIAT